MSTPPFTIIQDTREQLGWDFPGSRRAALETGDYTLAGLEHVLVIERKGTSSELANNVVEPRFERELERMGAVVRAGGFAALLFEFTMEEIVSFPRGSGIPRPAWAGLRVTGPFLLKRLCEIQLEHGVSVIPAGPRAREYASSLFKRAALKWLTT